jgi:lysophospholipase L1-like esterase
MGTERIEQLVASATANAAVFEEIRVARARLGQEGPAPPIADGKPRPTLLAQGDSWFNYWIGKDILYWLHKDFGREIDNIAVAGSTLNDVVYGLVPKDLLDFRQTNAPSRLEELVYRIKKDKPHALLLSVGGNDVAGAEFFSFLNNSKSGLPPTNEEVLDGVVNSTFAMAYDALIQTSLTVADLYGRAGMIVVTHGYDYPWPDGRGVLWIKGLIGPWFDATFNAKNYQLQTVPKDLQRRREILRSFIDSVNVMLLRFQQKYLGRVFHVDNRNTLTDKFEDYRKEWANELHPTDTGFEALAKKFEGVLAQHLPGQ